MTTMKEQYLYGQQQHKQHHQGNHNKEEVQRSNQREREGEGKKSNITAAAGSWLSSVRGPLYPPLQGCHAWLVRTPTPTPPWPTVCTSLFLSSPAFFSSFLYTCMLLVRTCAYTLYTTSITSTFAALHKITSIHPKLIQYKFIITTLITSLFIYLTYYNHLLFIPVSNITEL